jgi:hypothetical protein
MYLYCLQTTTLGTLNLYFCLINLPMKEQFSTLCIKTPEVHYLCPHKPRTWFTVNQRLTRNIPHWPLVNEAYIQNGWPHRPQMKPSWYLLPDSAQIETQEKKKIAV